MKLKPKLLGWFVKTAWIPNILVAVLATCWTLLTPRPLYEQWMEVVLFISLHALSVVACHQWLGASRSRLGFLYSRGYNRESIWSHQMLASVVSALHGLIPVAVVTLTPLRSWIQELKGTSAYPFVADRDVAVLPAWILGYAVAFTAFHYLWIRQKHPAKSNWSGAWLVGISVIAFGWFGDFSWPVLHGGWLSLYGVLLSLLFVVLLAVESRKLHQNIELH